MALNNELETLFHKYDMYHSSIINNDNIALCLDLKKDNYIYITISKNGVISSVRHILPFDFDFLTRIFPKILVHFFSKNINIIKRIIKGSKLNGNLILTRNDQKEMLVLRNFPVNMMDIIAKFEENFNLLNKNPIRDININSVENEKYVKYISHNIALQYAKYRVEFLGDLDDFDSFDDIKFLEKRNRENKEEIENLVILDLARYAYNLGINDQNVWNDIKKQYPDDDLIKRLCDDFNTFSYDVDDIYMKALICAEYENNNKTFMLNNVDIIHLALESAKNNALIFSSKFMEYWDSKKRYYKLLGNDEYVKICNDFLNSTRLILKDFYNKGDSKMKETKKDDIISKLKSIKENTRPDFSTIINDPIVIEEKSLSKDKRHEFLSLAAEEQAKELIKVLKEREQIKKDAEEFAKIILKKERQRKEIIKAAEEQAKRIFDLERKNEELKKLAEENAKFILENSMKYEEEINLRQIEDNDPVNKSDIDKIEYLLTALSNVKELDFAVNHPTIMQEVCILEEKIITYLTTHKNIVNDEEENNLDSKTVSLDDEKEPTERLSIIKNVYLASRVYEKDGRHTVIKIVPNQNKYCVTLYSVKDDNDDILTEIYFDDDEFNSDVIKELCDIYSRNTILIASKIDNIPDGLGDYLVIDNRDNAIKFMGCPIKIIEIAKAYL